MKRMIDGINKDMHKYLNELKENINKHLKKFKVNSNKQLNEIRETLQNRKEGYNKDMEILKIIKLTFQK